MSLNLPSIDPRNASDIVREIENLLSKTIPELQPQSEPARALINIVARFGEIVIDRLNRAPERNFLAFLDLLGVSARPPQPARVPLTFYLSSESVESTTVPAGTQVAAEAMKGESAPVIFETERELTVVSVKLESLLLRDGDRDRYVQYDSLIPLTPPGGSGKTALVSETMAPAGAQTRLIPHTLYIGFEMYPHWPAQNQVQLEFTLEKSVAAKLDPRILQWEICTPGQDVEAVSGLTLVPHADETENLTKSGRVVFRNLPEFKPIAIGGLTIQWLRCRLQTPITHASSQDKDVVRTAHLPNVKSLSIHTLFDRPGLSIDQAFANNLKLDITKDFFPFGERPKFGDTLYLASEEVFSNSDAFITCEITLTNPASGAPDQPIPPVVPRNTKLQWEFWDGQAWTELGISDLERREVRPRVIILDRETAISEQRQFSDTTQSLSVSGSVTFTFSRSPAPLEINGQKSYWIRVRIISGNYGQEAHYEVDLENGGYVMSPPSLAPPSIRSIRLTYSVDKTASPKAVLTYNDFIYKTVGTQSPFAPFTPPVAGVPPVLYFGFTLPSTTPVASAATAHVQPQQDTRRGKFPGRSMSLFVGLADLQKHGTSSYDEQSVIAWEYWNGQAWTKWTVRDGTMGIRRSGLIRILVPADSALKSEFGYERYWMRMRQVQPWFEPTLQRIVLNTTMALQGFTLSNEILGTSNGQPSQKLKTTHAPVLEGQQLEVRELTAPSSEEQSRIEAEEGDDAVRAADGVGEKKSEVWVRWHQVPNFHGSKPRDRHYLLDRATGEIIFGDGAYGLIPNVLPGNIRMRLYRTGGGDAGNRPAFNVKQLKTAVPYIDKLINWEPAAGGSDEESNESLLLRGPRTLRHGGRAVTVEDFEDLAMLASPEVARARCVPLFDLKNDRDARFSIPGIVSVIVVPHSTSPRPTPNTELLDRVQNYLDSSRSAAVAASGKLILVHPEYVSIDVQVEVRVDDPDTVSEVELGVTLALESFFHPLTGGFDGNGWDFGRMPHRSDVYGLIERTPGVSHVARLQIQSRVDREGADKTPNFLVCCGRHEVVATLEV